MKAIAPFVDFSYSPEKRKPSAKAKRLIKTYFDEVSALQNRPHQVKRYKNPEHLAQAQQFAQHEKPLKHLKVAFVPTDGESNVSLRFTKAGVVATAGRVHIRSVPLSRAGLLRDAPGHVRERIGNIDAKQFTIQAGRYEIPIPYLPQSVPAAVARLVARYGGNAPTRRKKKNNHWSRWLHGLNAYTFSGQDNSTQQYLIEKQKAIKDAKIKRRSAARKRARVLGRR
jgi:hypothetical protein